MEVNENLTLGKISSISATIIILQQPQKAPDS